MIFFSYSRVDGEEFTLKLAKELINAGANVWVDQLNIGLGKLWDQEIEKALKEAECVLFIATEHSATSNNVLNEVYFAIEENKQVIPILASQCALPFRLKRLQHIDFTADYQKSLNRLLKALNLEVPKENISIPNKKSEDANAKKDKSDEQVFWEDALATNSITAFEEYISMFPEGDFREEAKKRISDLKHSTDNSNQQSEYVNHIDSQEQHSYKKQLLIIGSAIIFIAIIIFWIKTSTNHPISNDATSTNQIQHEQVKEETNQERNKKVVLECIEAYKNRDMSAFTKTLSPDIIDYGDLKDSVTRGIENIKTAVSSFFAGAENGNAENVKAVAEGDSVIVYLTWSWDIKIKGKKKRLKYNDVEVYKLDDNSGKIISHSNSSALTDAYISLINQ